MRRPPPLSEFLHYPVTAGTSFLAIGVTLYWWSDHDIDPLLANEGIRVGEVWRLATSALPHVDPLHLIFNVYWLWVFGTLVESTWGSARTFAIFLLLAVGSMAPEYAILEGGVGLSGVGYGLFGLVWVLSRRDGRFSNAVDVNTVALFVAWFVLCIVLTVGGTMAVANIAHGAGAGLGMLLGWSIVSRGLRIAGAAMIAVTVISGIAVSIRGRSYVNFSRDGSGEATLGYQALKGKNERAAIYWCSEAIRIDPNNAGTWFNLGVAHHRLRETTEAAAAYRKAAELDPQSAQFRKVAEEFR